MKKILLAALVMSIFQTAYTEQDWATSSGSCFAKGNLNISAGLSVWWLGFYSTVDYAIHDAISVGGGIGYKGYGNSMYRYNYLPIAVRGSFHPFNLKVLADKIGIRDKLDTYIGISTGWSIGWSTRKKDDIYYLYDDEPSVGGFLFRENIGARYYFSPNFYGYAEEGAGFGNFNFGVGLKL